MNCCNEYGNCNQGRNCPVRVGRVGWSYPRSYDCIGSNWRRNVGYLAKWMVVVTMALLFSSAIVFYAA